MLIAAGKVGDFGIFTTQFDDDIGLRIVCSNGFGAGNDFLQKRDVQVVGQGNAAGPGDSHGDLTVAKDFIGVLE